MEVRNWEKQNVLEMILDRVSGYAKRAESVDVVVKSIKEEDYADFIGACDMAMPNITGSFKQVIGMDILAIKDVFNIYREAKHITIVTKAFMFEKNCSHLFENIRAKSLGISDIDGSKIYDATAMFKNSSFGRLVLPKNMAPSIAEAIFCYTHVDNLVAASDDKQDWTCIIDGSKLLDAPEAFRGAIIKDKIWIQRLCKLRDARRMFLGMHCGWVKLTGTLEYETAMEQMTQGLGLSVFIDMQFLRSKVHNNELDEVKRLLSKRSSTGRMTSKQIWNGEVNCVVTEHWRM